MKKLLMGLTIGSFVLLAFAGFMPGASATAEANNWYVCKYVGPPGTPNETLAGGNNPIFVDENAIDVSPVSIGATFGDAQTHSVVIAGPYAPPGVDPEPTCPTTTPPVTTTAPPITTQPPVITTQPPVITTAPPVITTAPPTTPAPVITIPPVITTVTPVPPACPGKVTTGPWYGDPRINITLVGKGTFVVSGGVQRFTGTTTFTETLACNETFKIGRYKVERGHYLTVTLDGAVVLHVKPPRVRA
jgi:hypothetical protein